MYTQHSNQPSKRLHPMANQPIRRMATRLPTYWLLLIAFIATPLSPAIALTEDVKKPVEIDANSALFDKKKGYAVYEGNVQIKQGSMLIQAWKIEIFAPKNNISKIVASGSPVKFRQRMDDGKLAQGQAKRMTYLIKDKVINFSGGARLSQDQDSFASNVITYSLRTGELKAGNNNRANKKATGRVKAIFYPTN